MGVLDTPRAWWACLALWWSVVNVQHTHDVALGPQVPAKQISCMAIAGGIVGGAHKLVARPYWAYASDAAVSTATPRAWWACLARWWSVVSTMMLSVRIASPRFVRGHAHSERPRGLVRLLVVTIALRTSGVTPSGAIPT